MNINFFITSLGGGGAERVVCNLANYLVGKGHSVAITVLRGDERAYMLDRKVTVSCLQSSYYRDKKKFICRIKEIFNSITFLKNLSEESLLVSFLELPIAYSLVFRCCYHQKLIICERNNPEFYSIIYQKIFKWFSNRADGCICQTNKILEWYLPFINSKTKTKVIPNAINKDVLSAEVSNRESKVIMTMGRLEPQKNHKLLISAFAEIIKKYPAYKLNIYGKGILENELYKKIVDLRVDKYVDLKGFTNHTVSAFQESSIFVLTSNHEGMPNVLAEAMAMGLSCISTDCGGGGARDLIQDGVNGVLINKNDGESLVEAISRIIEDEEYANSIAGEAVKIRNKLNPDNIHEQWELFFKQLFCSNIE